MQNGATALILAAQMGHTDLVTQLLDRGADVNATPDVSNLILSTVSVGVWKCMWVCVCECVCVRVHVSVCMCSTCEVRYCCTYNT